MSISITMNLGYNLVFYEIIEWYTRKFAYPHVIAKWWTWSENMVLRKAFVMLNIYFVWSTKWHWTVEIMRLQTTRVVFIWTSFVSVPTIVEGTISWRQYSYLSEPIYGKKCIDMLRDWTSVNFLRSLSLFFLIKPVMSQVAVQVRDGHYLSIKQHAHITSDKILRLRRMVHLAINTLNYLPLIL